VIVERLLAKTAALEPAERGGGIEDVVAVDPHGSRTHAIGDGVGLADVSRPDRRGQAVVSAVGPLDHVFHWAALRRGSVTVAMR
jgi:hypothetical protein